MSTKKGVQPNASRYTYTVSWSEEDMTFIGRVAEFPSLGAHGSTEQGALKQIRAAVKFVLDDLRQSGDPVPQPFGEQKFSGKLNLRIPPFMHRNLVIQAAQQRISLNQLINLKLEGAAPISLVGEESEHYSKNKRNKP